MHKGSAKRYSPGMTKPLPAQHAAAPDPVRLADIADDLVKRALAAGADAADASLSESRALEASVRDGALEEIERSESIDAGLRVLVGKRQAGVAFSDLSEDGRRLAVERAVAMAKAAPEDPYAGLLDSGELARSIPEIEMYDAPDWDAVALEETALKLEAAARSLPEIVQIAGCGASVGARAGALVASNGFVGTRLSSSRGLGVAPVAKRGDFMERDYESDSKRRLSDLKSPEEIGRIAAERAVARLGSEKIASGKRPVLFDKRVAGTFIGSLLGAISGPSVARGVSFLRDKLGERIFSEGIDVIEDPLRAWGQASRAHDGEGAPVRPAALIEDGVLTTWLLNAASARQLGLETTGHASARLGGAPGVSTSNVHLAPGETAREDFVKSMADGVIVMEMFGPSLNANTGDWSVGVAGFHVVGGEIAGPTSEITVAGNLLDIYARLEPADDLEFRGSTNAPSVFVDGLTIGGR